jgi:hypothetical protein
MAAQALAATATVLALVWLADHHLRELPERRRRWATWTIIGLCVVYRPLASAWWFSFQPILLGSPGIAWALVFLHLGRWWPLVAAVTLALASREAAILSCLGLAWYAWMVARRPRAALAIAAAALATAALVFLVVMPWAQAYQGWGHAKRLGASGDPVGKIRYLVTTLGCAAFLPLAAPLAALAALPGMALNLSVTMANQYSGGFHYQAHIAVFLLAAAIQGTAHLLHHLPPGSRWLRWGWPMAAVLALAIALGDALPLRKFVTSLDPRPWISGARLAGDLERALAQIGDDIPLAADPKLGPHMARRYRSLKDLERRGTLEQVPSGMLLVVRHTWWEALSVDKTLVIPVSTEGQIDILRRR